MPQYHEDGYIRCFCGQWAVGLHSDCRSMMTREDIERWKRL